MKKFFLWLLILVDLAAMGASVFFLYQYIQSKRHENKITVDMKSLPILPPTPVTQTAVSSAASSSSLMTQAKAAVSAPAVATPSSASSAVSKTAEVAAPVAPASSNHNVLFVYFNAKAKEVFIRADFTGWRAEPMKKMTANKWVYTAVLTPGEYAYCFSVDGRSIKDPANKRTKRVGQTVVSAKTVGPSQTPADQ